MEAMHIDINSLSTRFTEVLAIAEEGKEVIITENEEPRARLVPVATSRTFVLGLHPGSMTMARDFDEPLTEEGWGGEM